MTTYQQTFDPVPGHAQRFSDLVRSLTPDEAQQRVPGMTWTAAEVAAHVATVLVRYAGNPTRAATRADLAEQNAAELEAFALGADVHAIASRIGEQISVIASVASRIPLDMTFPFHLGLTVTASAGWANLLSELLVHGDDISRATGRPWTFPEADLEGFWRTLMPSIAAWMRPEAVAADEVYELRFSFGPVLAWVHDGTVDTEAPRGPDHVIDVGSPGTELEFAL